MTDVVFAEIVHTSQVQQSLRGVDRLCEDALGPPRNVARARTVAWPHPHG